MLWKIQFENVLDKVMNCKQNILHDEIEFVNTIAVVSLFIRLPNGIISIKASILLVMQDRKD